MSEPNILESGMRERIGRRNSDLVGTMHVSKVCPSCPSTCVNPTKQPPPSHQSWPMSPTDHIENPGLGCLGWALVGDFLRALILALPSPQAAAAAAATPHA